MSGKRSCLVATFTILMALACIGPLLAQDLHPSRRPSPMGLARGMVGDTYVQLVYSRPYKRGRDNIFGSEESGALVPFGKVWRTGANEATTLTATGDLLFAGQRLPAGTYSVFSTPGPDSWTIHFSPQLNLWGTMARNPESGEMEPAYDPAQDVLTITATPQTMEEEVDQFTISFEGEEMVWKWITTEVVVPVAPAVP